MFVFLHPDVSALAFFQSTQLNLFERFLNQAVSGINSTSITSGMQTAAYVVLLVGFLWQVYQAALHGGDVRGLGTNLIKYVVTALIVMNYTSVFTTVNQGFVNAGNWISNSSGAGNLFENWQNDLSTQFSQDGSQQLWGLVTADIPALIDGLLIIVAYILYPFVIAIFGFFYIFYGSVLYIFGPIVIALMPLGAANRLAKAYVENVFIWNAWPILYGGFGALLSAVQMGQIGQMLGANNFLGAFGNLEGSFLIGFASIIYSLAIAVIPFIAKRIVSGDVGSTASALIGAAATALTAGAAAIEGATVGAAAAASGAGSATTTSSSARSATVPASATSTASATRSGDMPAPSQRGPDQIAKQTRASAGSDRGQQQNSPDRQPAPTGDVQSVENGAGSGGGTVASSVPHSPTADEHAEFMREHLASAFASRAGTVQRPTGSPNGGASVGSGQATRASGSSGASHARRHGAQNRPSMRRYDIGTWGAFHAARLATYGAISGGRAASGAVSKGVDALTHPVESAEKLGSFAGRTAGAVVNTAASVGRMAQSGLQAVSNPVETAQKGTETVAGAMQGAANHVVSTAQDSVDAARSAFSSSYRATRGSSENQPAEGAEE